MFRTSKCSPSIDWGWQNLVGLPADPLGIVSLMSELEVLWFQGYSEHESASRSVVPNCLWPPKLQPSRLLCPWNSPGKNTGVGCHFLLQGIYRTQGLNPGLLHWKQNLVVWATRFSKRAFASQPYPGKEGAIVTRLPAKYQASALSRGLVGEEWKGENFLGSWVFFLPTQPHQPILGSIFALREIAWLWCHLIFLFSFKAFSVFSMFSVLKLSSRYSNPTCFSLPKIFYDILSEV